MAFQLQQHEPVLDEARHDDGLTNQRPDLHEASGASDAAGRDDVAVVVDQDQVQSDQETNATGNLESVRVTSIFRM